MLQLRGVFLNSISEIVVVGVGGIGSWVLEPLVRMLITNDWSGRLVLIDDDKVESKNLGRQGFLPSEIGMNKVAAWHLNRLNPLVIDVDIQIVAHPIRLDSTNVDAYVKELSLIILCPDNHAVRALVANKAAKMKDITVFTSGNELFNGNTHVLVRRGGEDLTPTMHERHEEVFQANTETQMAACTDLIDKGNAQILMTNFMAATSVLLAFYQLANFHTPVTRDVFMNELPNEVYFNALTGKMRTQSYAQRAPVLGLSEEELRNDPDALKEVRSVLAQHSLSA